MNHRDPHSALKTDIVASSQTQGVELKLVKLQWGKDDVGYSLHAAPHSYTTSGMQITDLLSYLGFHRSQCHCVTSQECYVRWSSADFSVDHFGPRLADAFAQLKQASQHLERCGYFLPQPEGWGYFQGRPSGTRQRPAFVRGERRWPHGLRHTAPEGERRRHVLLCTLLARRSR